MLMIRSAATTATMLATEGEAGMGVCVLPVTFEVEKGCSMLSSCLSWAQSLLHYCRVQYAGPAQQCIADSSALNVAVLVVCAAPYCDLPLANDGNLTRGRCNDGDAMSKTGLGRRDP